MNFHTDSGISRRQAMGAASSFVLLPSLSSCGWLQNQPIAVAANVWVGYEPMFLARDRSWLDAAQVTLLETRSAVESIEALRSGKVQAAALTLDEVLAARASGLALSVVLVFNVSLGADMLLAQPGITQLAQLKGKRIGYEASSVSEVMLAEILNAAGLTRQEIRLEKVGVDEQLSAWQNRTADAFITYEPVATKLLADGMTRLFDSRQIPDTIIDVLAVRADALDQPHVNALKHLIAVHFRALDELTRNPQDAAYRMAEHLNLPAEGVLVAFKGLILPTSASNYRLLSGAEPALLPTARRVTDILRRSGVLSRDETLVGLINPRYLPTDGLMK